MPRTGVGRRERVIGNPWPGIGNGGQKCRLSGIRQTNKAGIRDHFQPKPDRTLDSPLPGVGAARRLIPWRLEVKISETAVAPGSNAQSVSPALEIGKNRFPVLFQHLRPFRHLEDHRLPVLASSGSSCTRPPVTGMEVPAITKIDQRVEVGIDFDPDVAAPATVSAIGASVLDMRLTPETDAAVSAGSRAHLNPGQIKEFHVVSSPTTITTGQSRNRLRPPGRRTQNIVSAAIRKPPIS